MNKFLQLIVLVALAFYNAIQTVTGGATLKRLAPSGVIDQGILGGFSGKVGPVVGGKWKDIDYMRGYVVPANPNTAGQQVVRAKFSALVALGRQILTSILQPYWDIFYSSQSGFNAFISRNYSTLDGSNHLQLSSIISKGTLVNQPIDAAVYAGSSVSITWTENALPGALSTDLIRSVVYDSSTDIFYNSVSEVQRLEEAKSNTVAAGLTASDLICFIFAYRGTGSEMVVSDSTSIQVTT